MIILDDFIYPSGHRWKLVDDRSDQIDARNQKQEIHLCHVISVRGGFRIRGNERKLREATEMRGHL